MSNGGLQLPGYSEIVTMPMDLGRWAPTQHSRRCIASDALRGAAAHVVLQPQCGAVRRAAIVSGFRTRRSRHCPPAPVGVLRRRRLASFIMCRAIMPLAGVCADQPGWEAPCHAMRAAASSASSRPTSTLASASLPTTCCASPTTRRRAAPPNARCAPELWGWGGSVCATDRGRAHA